MSFLGCSDLEVTKDFYMNTLGLNFVAQEGTQTLIFDLNNTKLRISEITDFSAQEFTVLGWMVTDITGKVRKLKSRGVEFVYYDQFDQDQDGIWTRGKTKIAWFLDPSGNNLSLTQN